MVPPFGTVADATDGNSCRRQISTTSSTNTDGDHYHAHSEGAETDNDSELAQYLVQLEQINTALSSDPLNVLLRKLQRDLQELVDLARVLHKPKSHNHAPKEPSSRHEHLPHHTHLEINSETPDRHGSSALSDDEHTVTKHSEIATKTKIKTKTATLTAMETVTSTTKAAPKEVTVATAIQPKRGEPAIPSNPKKRSGSVKDLQARRTKRQAHIEQVEKAHLQSQQSWLKFAGGAPGVRKTHEASAPKRHTISSSLKPVPILQTKSMFATPDNPLAKVGVIGSGKGMTDFGDRGRHTFSTTGGGDYATPSGSIDKNKNCAART